MEANMEEGEGRIEEGCGKERIPTNRKSYKVIYIYIYRRQEQECHLWLKQRLTPRKTASIMTLIEQMVETKGWKVARGLMENGRCRLCGEFNETVKHAVLNEPYCCWM